MGRLAENCGRLVPVLVILAVDGGHGRARLNTIHQSIRSGNFGLPRVYGSGQQIAMAIRVPTHLLLDAEGLALVATRLGALFKNRIAY